MKRNISITNKGDKSSKLILVFNDSLDIDPVAFAALFLTMNNMDEMSLKTRTSLMIDLYTGRYKDIEAGIIKDILEEFDITVDDILPLGVAAHEISNKDVTIDMFKIDMAK